MGHDTMTCVDQKLVRSDQYINFDARVKVRTNVRLLEVDIDASCICADGSNHHGHGHNHNKYGKAIPPSAETTAIVTETVKTIRTTSIEKSSGSVKAPAPAVTARGSIGGGIAGGPVTPKKI